MSDHALRVFKQPDTASAIAAVFAFGDIALNEQDLTQLSDTLKHYTPATSAGFTAANLVNDTRAIKAGDIFCAVIGSLQDGGQYITQALAANCAMVLQETTEPSAHGNISWQQNSNAAPIAIVSYFQLNQQLFEVAKAFYGAPQHALNIIGITGTNGKTSTSQIIANLLDSCQRNCAVIGTNGAGKLAQLQTIENTTPGATQLHQLLALFAQQNITDVAMEVSSHALEQKRVSANLFNTSVFTNLSRDHLDYHQTMTAYAEAKYKIFSANNSQTAVVNGDDTQAQIWLGNWPSTQPIVVYGQNENIAKNARFVQALNVQHYSQGVSFTLNTEQGQCNIASQLLGDFNVENLLAAIAVLLVEGIELKAIAQAITQLRSIIGRMEAFSAADKPTAVVDYAHTPDALASALDACRLHCQGKLWLVFGCGGDRDIGKRAIMAQVAQENADHIIITNDNPRSEAPEAIAKDILTGFQHTNNVETILDRKTAVMTALNNANANDIVLCAGKGHEDYIIFANETLHYDERAVVNAFYAREVTL